MADDLPLLYWDACIFYEHLNEEPVSPLRRQAIDECLSENKEKRNKICTSVITHLEVIPKKLDKDKEARYRGSFNSLYFFDIEVDRSVIVLARSIKDYYFVPPAADGSGYKILSTGDAVHLATAIIHRASELYTRDKNSKGGNIKLVGLPAASPNGKICGIYDLRVTDPEAAQGALKLS
jgi:predicted nucleic acid-binding protein